jgi:alanyl-tRNA synthetase
MHSREVRSGFLKFFESQNHRVVTSSSLVPVDDPTLLFTNAGMNQFKDLFLGKEKRDYVRAASSQKCMRVSGKHNDLDNVGPSLRHHTFFEMLGNFSFGDYFKPEAIEFAWRVLTEVWKIPGDRMHASVFKGEAGIPRDDEAYDLWRRYLPAEKVVEYGADDNFWQMGDTGPCGRCSEIYFEREDGPVEIWNNVFMEFERSADGVLKPLPAPSIDTGMGLERVCAVLQGSASNYDTDLFQPILRRIGELTGHAYGRAATADVSMRVVADHIRATTFLIGDGVVPSNEWRGYVLRKIMRRAMRHGKKLGATEPVLHRLVDTLVSEMGDAYPGLRANRDNIVTVVRNEEERFDAVLNAGLPKLEDVLERAAAGNRAVPGEEMFRLYDSLGVPVDFIEDLAGERGLTVDREGFERAMEAQRERARAGGSFEVKKHEDFVFASPGEQQRLNALGERFEGYATTRVEGARVEALFDAERRQVSHLVEDQDGFVALDRTPFYVEAGGQVSDAGTIASASGSATVEAMLRLGPGAPRLHFVHVAKGAIHAGQDARAEVDARRRDAIRRNHTATHLLHAALRTVLGTHVKQAGSLVAPDRLRFDFVHFSPVTREQLDEIERIVNEQVYVNTPVQTEVRRTDEAIAGGAMALFGEKYGESVRVVSVPGFSMELCGGTHCRATGDIGPFTIVTEGGVAAGIRRIEAFTGEGAVKLLQHRAASLSRILDSLHAGEDQATGAIEKLHADVKRLTKEVGELKVKAAMGGGAGAAQDDSIDVGGVRLVARKVEGLDKNALRTLSDSLRERIRSGVVVLASAGDDKVTLVVSVTKDLTDRVQAGAIVRQIAPIVGGGGGGRPDFAEAGGRDVSKIETALAESRAVVARLLAAE